MPKFLAHSLALAAAALMPHAGAAPLAAGEYIQEGGAASLSIARKGAADFTFQLNAVGASGHVCDLGGTVRNGRAVLAALEKDHPCVVRFAPADNGLDVTAGAGGACQYFCGMRASFEGRYLKPAPACEDKARAASARAFKRLYDQKDYVQARATLEPVLGACAATLHWSELGSLRNDLAITQYKLGDYAGCLRTLQPYVDEARQSEAELRAGFPNPDDVDADQTVRIARAARTNLGLCGKARK